MPKKENQRIVLTKRLLKESLLRLISKKSIQNISVSELCENAGINRSTFYNHYGKPYDVLRDIEMDIVDGLDRIWESNVSHQNYSISKRFEILCTYMKNQEAITKLLFQNDELNTDFADLLSTATHVKALYEKDLVNIKDPDSKKLAMTFLATGAYQMMRQWLLEDIPKSPKEMGDLISEMQEAALDLYRQRK